MGIVAALGNTVPNIGLATAIINFPLHARVARAETMLKREAGFVDAARLSGHREIGVLLGQIMPNILPIMVGRCRSPWAMPSSTPPAPATPCSAPKIGQATMLLHGKEIPVRPNLGLQTQPISFIGLPVVAAPWHEHTALRAAAMLERAGVVSAPVV